MLDGRLGFSVRRIVLLLVVLLIAPLTSAWPISDLPIIESEWVVIEEDGWTSHEWDE